MQNSSCSCALKKHKNSPSFGAYRRNFAYQRVAYSVDHTNKIMLIFVSRTTRHVPFLATVKRDPTRRLPCRNGGAWGFVHYSLSSSPARLMSFPWVHFYCNVLVTQFYVVFL